MKRKCKLETKQYTYYTIHNVEVRGVLYTQRQPCLVLFVGTDISTQSPFSLMCVQPFSLSAVCVCGCFQQVSVPELLDVAVHTCFAFPHQLAAPWTLVTFIIRLVHLQVLSRLTGSSWAILETTAPVCQKYRDGLLDLEIFCFSVLVFLVVCIAYYIP